MLLLTVLSLTLVVGACAPAPQSGSANSEGPADLVLVDGRVITMEEELAEAEAMAARDGRIVALGSSSEIESWIGDGTEVVDLQGALAVPGLIEAHGHFMGIGDSRIQLDLRSASSWQAVVEQVAAAVAEAEPGQWIRGRGWHQDKWEAQPQQRVAGFPVHGALSEVSPDNPVMLTHASGHALLANARAMVLAGVDSSTADPAGGEIVRDSEGNATGLFNETAQGLIGSAWSAAGGIPEDEARRMVRLASEECLRKGITSFHDAGSPFATVDLLRRAAADGDLGVRLWVMIRDGLDRLRESLPLYRSRGEAGGFLSVGGIKLSIDGALGSRGAWLLQPYSDAPETTGLNLVPVEDARQVADLALEHGYQLAIHAIGDRANREVLDLYEEVFAARPEGGAALRWRVEHAQHLHPDEVPRFAELGVIASVQGVHCTSDGPWVPERLGDQRSEEGAYVWRKLIDSGAMVINGTDAPVEDVDPIASYAALVSRRMANGKQFYPEQSMTRLEALASYTRDAAWAAFEEAEKGTLALGKLADVTVLSKDILQVPEEEIQEAKVLYTIVNGEVAYRAQP